MEDSDPVLLLSNPLTQLSDQHFSSIIYVVIFKSLRVSSM